VSGSEAAGDTARASTRVSPEADASTTSDERRGRVEVGPATPDEWALLGSICVAAYRSVPGVVCDEGYAKELADVRSRATRDGVVVLAARVDGRPVGTATVVLDVAKNPDFAEGVGDEAVLRMVAVDPSVQRRGIGRVLVEAAIEVARRHGRRRLTLHTQGAMRAAQRLYATLGFRRVEQADWSNERVSLLAYALDLDPVPAAGPDTAPVDDGHRDRPPPPGRRPPVATADAATVDEGTSD
jgi:GNAT superfamily N-acetyltransferase